MPSKEEHYLGNPLLKRANINVELTQEQLLELIRCSEDPIYFSKKYIKIVTLDEGLVNFEPYPFQENMLKNFHNKRFNICKLPRQSGKALSLDTPIPTPEGWTTMGEIKLGDKVLSPNGKAVSVIKKTETMYDHECYRIYFDNGDEVVADAEHLWKVNSSYWTAGERLKTTKDIFIDYSMKSNNKRGAGVQGAYYIKISEPLESFNTEPLPIDPYLLGLWLGDGSACEGRIVAHKDDYEIYKESVNVEAYRVYNNCIRFKCAGLKEKLKEANLLYNKHIPQIYLRSSFNERLELLRGLMDSDGSIKANTRSFEFYQKSHSFILQVVELLATLGIKSRIRPKKINGETYYTIPFTTTERVFNLPRKYNLTNNDRPLRVQDKRIFIQKIEKVESVPVACIAVDSFDHLFLCGKSFIPTHNSTTTVAYLVHNMLFNEHTSIAILANKAQTAKDILARFQTAYENLPKWLQQGVKSCNKTSIELENGSKIIAASTSASAVRGGTYSLLMLDEYAFVPEQIANNFMRSVYPTITSGHNSKVIIISCVTKDTYILTPNGYRRIERLIHKDKDGAYFTEPYTVMGRNKFYSSNIIVNNGKSPTNIIKTRYDEIECSENHKLWALKDGKQQYIKSSQLSVGDSIAIRFNTQVFGNNDYIIGDNIELACLIGLFISRGKLVNNQVLISSYKDLSKLLRNLDLDFTVIDYLDYTITSESLIKTLSALGFSSDNNIIPDKVLSWSKPNITALISGIFAVEDNLSSSSRELLRQVQLLLLNHGFWGELKDNTITLDNNPPTVEDNLVWLEIVEIQKSENEVFDVSLPDIEDDEWCHSVLYNNFLGHQTPSGLNHYYKLWMGAKEGTNEYHPFEIHWSDVPGRDDNWKQQQIANIGQKNFDQEFNTEFLGSSETLISGSKLSSIVTKPPLKTLNSLDIYEDPIENHVYVTIVDTARGVEKDYHAFTIIDISSPPYNVVAKYRNNEIKPEMYSYVVKDAALKYNKSFLLCEVNDIGYQVAKDLVDDEYPNMLMCSTKSRSGQFIGQNFSGKYELGVKMQKNIKKVGCIKLKTLIEENILLINDRDIFAELTTFVQKGSTFEAEMGKNDDLVACLVLFAWLTTNQYFKDIIDIDLRKRLLQEKKDKEEDDIMPFGYPPEQGETIIDEKTNTMWEVVEEVDLDMMMNIFNYY